MASLDLHGSREEFLKTAQSYMDEKYKDQEEAYKKQQEAMGKVAHVFNMALLLAEDSSPKAALELRKEAERLGWI